MYECWVGLTSIIRLRISEPTSAVPFLVTEISIVNIQDSDWPYLRDYRPCTFSGVEAAAGGSTVSIFGAGAGDELGALGRGEGRDWMAGGTVSR